MFSLFLVTLGFLKIRLCFLVSQHNVLFSMTKKMHAKWGCKHLCVHLCVSVYVFVCARVWAHVCCVSVIYGYYTYMYVWVCVCVYLCVCKRAYVCARTCVCLSVGCCWFTSRKLSYISHDSWCLNSWLELRGASLMQEMGLWITRHQAVCIQGAGVLGKDA